MYLNAYRVHLFPDASFWVNVGVGNESTDDIRRNPTEFHALPPQTVNYQVVNLEEYEHEFYMLEKPFFNSPYIFIIAVLEHKIDRTFEYIRPHGHYFDMLNKKFSNTTYVEHINTDPNNNPKIQETKLDKNK